MRGGRGGLCARRCAAGVTGMCADVVNGQANVLARGLQRRIGLRCAAAYSGRDEHARIPPRILAALLAVTLTLIVSSSSFATGRNLAIGLEPGGTYEIEVDGIVVIQNAAPSPEGVLVFDANVATTCIVRPQGDAQAAADAAPTTSGIDVEGPLPNPTSGFMRFTVRSEEAGQARVSLIDVASGAIRATFRTALGPGRNEIPVEIPARLPSGFYVARIELFGSAYIRKFVLLRN